MREGDDQLRLRQVFVMVGAVIGACLAAGYLYRSAAASSAVPDPIWLRFVNVALIMFCSIYLANFLRRLVAKGRK